MNSLIGGFKRLAIVPDHEGRITGRRSLFERRKPQPIWYQWPQLASLTLYSAISKRDLRIMLIFPISRFINWPCLTAIDPFCQECQLSKIRTYFFSGPWFFTESVLYLWDDESMSELQQRLWDRKTKSNGLLLWLL